MTPAEMLAACRVHGHHGDLAAWRDLCHAAIARAPSIHALARSYREGRTLEGRGLKCGCVTCKEREAAPSISIEQNREN